MLTLEIVKIHIAEAEHRVAHLILNNLCAQYPDDPFLWNTLGRLYLEIGKKPAAVAAFSKSEEAITKQSSITPQFAGYLKHFSMYRNS